MKYTLIALLMMTTSFAVSAQQPQQMSDMDKLLVGDEIMRSPVYTKRAYRQAKQIDAAAVKKQNSYIAKMQEEDKWDDEKVKSERARLNDMRPVNFEMENVNLADKGPEINRDPSGAFYDLSRNIKTGGYGATPDEMRADQSAARAAVKGELTEEERQSARTPSQKPFGAKRIQVTPDQLKK